MNQKIALELIEKIIEQVKPLDTNKQTSVLSYRERQVIIGIWEGKAYKEIAELADYKNKNYLSSKGGPQLLRLITEGLVQLEILEKVKISKTNLKEVLEENQWKIRAKLELLENTDSEREKASATTIIVKKVINELGTRKEELPDGPLPFGSKFYIERQPIESKCLGEILKPWSLLRIRSPQKMGKTSLIDNLIGWASKKQYKTVYLDINLVNKENLSNSNKFLKWFAATVGLKLKLFNKINDFWDEDIFGSKVSCGDYFENYLLPSIAQPIVLVIDNVDLLFNKSYEVTQDFFQLLRNWHEESKNSNSNKVWKNLHLILSYSTEVYQLPDINSSPFNVGYGIKLPEFIPSQIEDLARRYEINLTEKQTAKIIKLVGGHPYLINLAFSYLKDNENLEVFLKISHTDTGIYANYLRQHLSNLQKNPTLSLAFKQLLASNSPVELEAQERFKLESMGLINLKNEEATIRSELYRRYFQNNLK